MVNPLEQMQLPAEATPEREQLQYPDSITTDQQTNTSFTFDIRQADQKFPLDPHQSYSVHPDSEYRAMNATPGERIYFFNGMQMEPQEIYEAAKSSANVFGREVVVIPNDKEDSFFSGVMNGFLATISHEQGLKAEPEAVKLGVNMLFDEMSLGKGQTTLIYYSQGNLIGKTTAEQFLKQVQEQCSQLPHHVAQRYQARVDTFLKERLFIRRYGSPYNLAPAGVKSVQAQHSLDGVGVLGHLISAKDALMMALRGQEYSRAVRTTAKPRGQMRAGDRHEFTNHYMGNNPLFFVASTRGHSPEAQAQILFDSVKKSDFSQPEYNKIVAEYISPSDARGGIIDLLRGRMSPEQLQRFAEKLITLAPEGKIGANQFSESTMALLRRTATPSQSKEATTAPRVSRRPMWRIRL